MIGELQKIAGQCDGVRCDMAMLVLPDVFERTWGRRAPPFWPEATRRVRERVPDFRFMAEVYWDLEWTMQQQGFDYAYDKRLYDRLRDGHARPVREHLHAGLDYQNKLARFLENHDEPRAAATLPPGNARGGGRHHVSLARACGSSTRGSSRAGGSASRRTSCARPQEPVDERCRSSTIGCWRCCASPAVRDGQWRLLECAPAWDGNWTWTASSPGPGKVRRPSGGSSP